MKYPVLTIISGFTYHMSCTESWASNQLSVHRLSIMAQFVGFNTDIYNVLFQSFINATRTFNINKNLLI